MFLLSFFEVPVGVRKRLDFYRSRIFWQGDELKRKYWLAKWDIICRPKDQGGLGIDNLEVKNRCLLSKWMYKLSVETEATWAQILRSKYLQSKTLSEATVRPTDSPFWKGLMRVKVAFFNRTKFIVGNGNTTRFWENTWLGEMRWRSSIRPCIILFNDVMLLLQRLCSPFPLIFSFGGCLLVIDGKLGFIWCVDLWKSS